MGVNHDSLAVVNTGPGTLSWSARLAMGEPWLAFVGPTGGTAPAKLRLAFNPAGLPTGIYRDTVVVAAENAAGSPGRVPVEFVVHPCLAVPLVLNAQVTDSITTWDCAAPHRPTGCARIHSPPAHPADPPIRRRSCCAACWRTWMRRTRCGSRWSSGRWGPRSPGCRRNWVAAWRTARTDSSPSPGSLTTPGTTGRR